MEIYSPSIFTNGLLKYKQGKHKEAMRLLLKAGNWMPSLKNDSFYKAVLLLIESELGTKVISNQFREALESLANSPYKDTSDYAVVVSNLKKQL